MPTAPTLESLAAETDPLIGRVVSDRYKVMEAIGNGGMGRVYRAIQAPLDRVVALKVLGAGHDRDPNFYKRFFLEASVTAKLTHPNTITLFDYGRTDDGIFYIAMEYLAGRTLSMVMQQEGPLVQERVIHIAQQICRSLREAHALGIIHRDLKPANVMLMRQQDDHDFVKVLDFGLVKFFSGENSAEAEITNAGTFMGSPHYIAPEQARNQNPDQRCDIYSLGVLSYHMLTGRVPFTAQNPVDIILKHLHDPPVPPSQLRPDLQIAPAFEAIILKCMEKEREQRFQSMDELLLALKTVRAQIVGSSGPHSMPPQYDTFIGPRPGDGRAPGATVTPNFSPAHATPPTPPTPMPMALGSVPPTPTRPIALHAAVTQPPPPPLESIVASQPHPVPPSVAPVPLAVPAQKRGPLVIALAIAAVAVAFAVYSMMSRRAQESDFVPVPVPVAQQPIAANPPPAQLPATPIAPPVHAPIDVPAPTALAGTTQVRVTSTPTGAEVRDIDERILGTTPFEMSVPSNKPLLLTLHADGYKPLVLKQSKVTGEKLELPVTLKRDPRLAAKPDPAPVNKHSAGYKDDPY
jgi:serine/threonine protein kinase